MFFQVTVSSSTQIRCGTLQENVSGEAPQANSAETDGSGSLSVSNGGKVLVVKEESIILYEHLTTKRSQRCSSTIPNTTTKLTKYTTQLILEGSLICLGWPPGLH